MLQSMYAKATKLRENVAFFPQEVYEASTGDSESFPALAKCLDHVLELLRLAAADGAQQAALERRKQLSLIDHIDEVDFV